MALMSFDDIVSWSTLNRGKNMDNQQIAQVLEDAARLYRDEKIQWCRKQWINFGTNAGHGEAVMSMCAEGAIMKALGWSELDIAQYQASSRMDRLTGQQKANYWQVVGLVTRAATGEEFSTALHPWNDEVANNKQDVIDLFENVAKDLRNEEGNG